MYHRQFDILSAFKALGVLDPEQLHFIRHIGNRHWSCDDRWLCIRTAYNQSVTDYYYTIEVTCAGVYRTDSHGYAFILASDFQGNTGMVIVDCTLEVSPYSSDLTA